MDLVFKIRGVIKNYEWGKLGVNSMVAVLQRSADDNFKIMDDLPYSELWLGTHDSGPATIPHLANKKLLDWLQMNPLSLGENISKDSASSAGLPFLFKVLSVNKALSIQVHPDKQTASKLHKEFPQHYPDDNHKPELAIALTNFKALCGFRPLNEIKAFLQEITELQKIINVDLVKSFLEKGDLRSVFTALMTSSSSVYEAQILQIIENFKCNKYTSDLSMSVKDIFLQICEQYPSDIGCVCIFFLNYVKLKSGEAIFLAANEPHAYLSGDCIECMACSDNVVRAGLTPKFRDVQTLCSILTYICKSAEENMFVPQKDVNDPFVLTYAPPVKEFAIDSITLPSDTIEYKLKTFQSASILLIIKGSGVSCYEKGEVNLNIGCALFISANCDVIVKPSEELLMFRAYCLG
uniref:mannose-6-phosphate isomerase n=1 Tax=Parasteatoda tepidariorum TaxID=114398 RepID=A0A2L2YLT0_PARTP